MRRWSPTKWFAFLEIFFLFNLKTISRVPTEINDKGKRSEDSRRNNFQRNRFAVNETRERQSHRNNLRTGEGR